MFCVAATNALHVVCDVIYTSLIFITYNVLHHIQVRNTILARKVCDLVYIVRYKSRENNTYPCSVCVTFTYYLFFYSSKS
jgi:hypothetical protein